MKGTDWKARYDRLVGEILKAKRSNDALLADSAARGDTDGEHHIKVGRYQALSALFAVIDEPENCNRMIRPQFNVREEKVYVH